MESFRPLPPLKSRRWRWSPFWPACNYGWRIPPAFEELLVPCRVHIACWLWSSGSSTLKILTGRIVFGFWSPSQRMQADKWTWQGSPQKLLFARHRRFWKVALTIKCTSIRLLADSLSAANFRVRQSDKIILVGDGEAKLAFESGLIETGENFSGVGSCGKCRGNVSERARIHSEKLENCSASWKFNFAI